MTVQPRPRRTKPTRSALRSGAMAGAAAGIVFLAAGCATAEGEAAKNNADSGSSKAASSGSSSSGSSASASGESTSVKDGTYTAKGEYTSPGGHQSVTVKVTLTDGVISDVTVTPGATDSQSKKYQSDFAANVASQVKGKSLDDADVSVVASSSLTSEGFNEALAKIAEEAGA